MPKPHPERIHLKQARCPECREPFGAARLALEDDAVSARCINDKCTYRTELFWLGDRRSWMN